MMWRDDRRRRSPGTRRGRILLACAAACLLGAVGHASADISDTPLARYVNTPDPAYSYKLVDEQTLAGLTAYTLEMDSLDWRSSDEVDRTRWRHQVVVLVPDVLTTNTALVLIEGGRNPFGDIDPLIPALAGVFSASTGSVMAVVLQVPNQPLLFPDEDSGISEDALVAYSWDKAADTGDAEWAAYLPMTKAAVRGLDTIQSFVASLPGDRRIDDFAVTGFSKRGATAWLVAAVDPRVRAVAPGVFDILDMPIQIERHFESYGFYAPAISDYLDYDIVSRVRSPEGRFLTSIVDPLTYVEALDMPKLLLISTGDQFFLPDAANLYLDRLPGETLVRQIPNTDHGMTNGLGQAFLALLQWYRSIIQDTRRPSLEWRLEKGVLAVESDPPAAAGILWQATNPSARDFRLEEIGTAWVPSMIEPDRDGVWRVAVPPPRSGFTGYRVQLGFAPIDGIAGHTYGTPVFVTPDAFPFSLDDPIGDPQSPRSWRCRLEEGADGVRRHRCPPSVEPPVDFDSLLPFSIFGHYVTNLDALSDALAPGWWETRRARRACTATRLNIASRELGWYSRLDDESDSPTMLWQVYERAENAFARGRPDLAGRLCRSLNRR